MGLRIRLHRARTIAASMVIDRPEAIVGAPERAAAQRRTASGRLSCLARNVKRSAAGEESRLDAVAFRRSRRSRPSARSTHRRRPLRCARSGRCWERRTWLPPLQPAGPAADQPTSPPLAWGERGIPPTRHVGCAPAVAFDRSATWPGCSDPTTYRHTAPLRRPAATASDLPTGGYRTLAPKLVYVRPLPLWSYPRAMPCPVGPGVAIPAIRSSAAMPTAIAPITEKTACQISEGMVSFTMPCVA